MAGTITSLGALSGAKLYTNTALGATQDTISAGAATLYSLQVDNSANTGTAVYVKLYNSAVAIVVGTTAPDKTELVPAGVVRNFIVPEGVAYSNGIIAACVTNGGGTAGASAPVASVIVRATYTT